MVRISSFNQRIQCSILFLKQNSMNKMNEKQKKTFEYFFQIQCPKEIKIYTMRRQNGSPIMLPIRRMGLSYFGEQLLRGNKC